MPLRMKLVLFLSIFLISCQCKKSKEGEKPDWAKKDIRDFSDADMERLLDQWEEDEDPLEPDELPEHLRPQPALDFSQIKGNDPESILKLSKKGRSLMVFVTVTGSPTPQETEQITKLWQTSLWNNHIQTERYPVADNRVIFMFKDGSLAWDAKEYLIEQERCLEVTIENKSYPGKYSAADPDDIRTSEL